MSEDPIGFAGGDYNLYRYVMSNPTRMTDPSGNGPLTGLIAAGVCEGVAGTASAIMDTIQNINAQERINDLMLAKDQAIRSGKGANCDEVKAMDSEIKKQQDIINTNANTSVFTDLGVQATCLALGATGLLLPTP